MKEPGKRPKRDEGDNKDHAPRSRLRRELEAPSPPAANPKIDPEPLRLQCSGCNTAMQIAAKFAGKKVRCPKCQTVNEAPLPKPARPEPAVREAVSSRPIRDVIVVSDRERSDYEPRRRRRVAKQPASNALPWIVGGVFGFLFLLAGAGFATYLVVNRFNEVPGQIPPPVFAEEKIDFNQKIDFKEEKLDPVIKPPDMPLEKKEFFEFKDPDPFPRRNFQVEAPAQDIRAQLQDDQFRVVAALTPEDGQDPVRRSRSKAYLVHLQAGKKYTIDLIAPQFDAYLRLENSARQTVAQDDDGGVGLNSRIEFTANQTGDYRVYASSLGGRSMGPFTLTIKSAGAGDRVSPAKLPSLKLPGTTSPGVPLQQTRPNINGLNVTQLKVPTPNKIVGDIVWSTQGDVFFTLTDEGVLSRIALAGYVEEKRLDMQRRCGFLALSAQGLLAAMIDLQEVWVIDPQSLEVTKRIPATGVVRALSGPQLNFALAARRDDWTSRDGGVILLDLVKGEPVREFKVPAKHARITPDGKFYFAQGGIEQLCSFQVRIENQSLLTHQTTQRIAQNGQSICVSPDSKYVCLPSGGGNYGAGSSYSTFVYAVDNLRTPAFTLGSGAYPNIVAFDPIGEHVFAQNADKQLLVYTMTAIKRGEYSLTSGRSLTDRPRQFVPHPQGRKLLVLTENHLLFVELE